MTPADRKAIGDAVVTLVSLPEGSHEANDARARLLSAMCGQRFATTQNAAIDAAVRIAYAAGIAEGRAQVQRERDVDRLDNMRVRFDR